MEQKWYAEGLRFKCTGCGGCCKGPGGYVWVRDEEIEALAAATGLSFEDFAKKYVRKAGNRFALIDNVQGDCIFLDAKGRCMHYEARPVQCKTFPWWPEVVTSQSSWNDNINECPGINKKKLYSAEEIEEKLKENT